MLASEASQLAGAPPEALEPAEGCPQEDEPAMFKSDSFRMNCMKVGQPPGECGECRCRCRSFSCWRPVDEALCPRRPCRNARSQYAFGAGTARAGNSAGAMTALPKPLPAPAPAASSPTQAYVLRPERVAADRCSQTALRPCLASSIHLHFTA
jgi:hypothetical protein